MRRSRRRKLSADPDVRNYTYTFFEGKLYYRENSEMVERDITDCRGANQKS